MAADGGTDVSKHEMPVLTALSRAFHWQRLLDEGRVVSGSEIVRHGGPHQTTVNEHQERLFGRMDGVDSAPVASVDRKPSRASR